MNNFEELINKFDLENLNDNDKNFLKIIYNKIDEIKSFLNDLKKIDYDYKKIYVEGNVLKYDGKDLKVNYAENAKKINGKEYKDFFNEIKTYFETQLKTMEKKLIEDIENRKIKSNYFKDWFLIKEKFFEKDEDIFVIDTLPFIPSSIEIWAKLEDCDEKNGGANGIIVQIQPAKISTDGLFGEGFWIEDNQIKLKLKKHNIKPWIGNCKKISFKIIAWR